MRVEKTRYQVTISKQDLWPLILEATCLAGKNAVGNATHSYLTSGHQLIHFLNSSQEVSFHETGSNKVGKLHAGQNFFSLQNSDLKKAMAFHFLHPWKIQISFLLESNTVASFSKRITLFPHIL